MSDLSEFNNMTSTQLRQTLEGMGQAQLHDLPFGVIKLDGEAHVTFFSRTEARQSGYGDRVAIGLSFFTELAPCMARPEFVARVQEARRTGSLDIIFEHVGDFDDAQRELLVRMTSASDGGTWVCLQRHI